MSQCFKNLVGCRILSVLVPPLLQFWKFYYSFFEAEIVGRTNMPPKHSPEAQLWEVTGTDLWGKRLSQILILKYLVTAESVLCSFKEQPTNGHFGFNSAQEWHFLTQYGSLFCAWFGLESRILSGSWTLLGDLLINVYVNIRDSAIVFFLFSPEKTVILIKWIWTVSLRVFLNRQSSWNGAIIFIQFGHFS